MFQDKGKTAISTFPLITEVSTIEICLYSLPRKEAFTGLLSLPFQRYVISRGFTENYMLQESVYRQIVFNYHFDDT